MAEQQVWSGLAVTVGASRILHWNWTGRANNSNVPLKTVLDISTLTFNYFPSSGAANVARVWSMGETQRAHSSGTLMSTSREKTLHLPFPLALRLEPGGHVEVTAGSDVGVVVSANGRLVDV
jgi:hypothetical protein